MFFEIKSVKRSDPVFHSTLRHKNTPKRVNLLGVLEAWFTT